MDDSYLLERKPFSSVIAEAIEEVHHPIRVVPRKFLVIIQLN